MFEIILLSVVVLVALVIGGWYTHTRQQQRAQEFERELDRFDATENNDFHARFDSVFAQDTVDLSSDVKVRLDSADQDFDAADDDFESDDDFEETDPEEAPDWEMVVALTIMAPESQMFTGRAIKSALDQQEMHFGDMQIYHRYTVNNRRQTLFSVANILDPGTLLPDQMIAMKTPGLLMFARLPGPVNGLTVFDSMLDTAHQLTAYLGGILCDEKREPITDKHLEATRNRIFELNLSLQAGNKSDDDFN
ncbi:cell division protein ZipA C-terminal FtsZ-binding domain-containing protein [Methylophaga sp.]|uniref:cell division protein ZipA C-terminal FtsZ-binding domain-containing protein n=1 Tax=Methylophaga sp. TaxID=2024840 RepID=UPI00271D56A6|nr:cell division protein ZipA C-terminal FtsZ-binding domain-containing protein [Methylophaga sp.]MDO8825300.1 cell division protein ZipA C-terminal FtsZ-binding domain-containing protein [Methylophaga sp.]